MGSLKEQAIEIIKTKGLKKLEAPVQLASGAMSQDFVDGKLATAHFDDLEIASRAIVDGLILHGVKFDSVGGPTLGADALTIGIASIQRCRWFFVRKEPKGRGTNKLIEGSQIGEGERCLIVEETGASVVAVATLVDRGETARPLIESRGILYYPLATYLDLGIDPVEPPN